MSLMEMHVTFLEGGGTSEVLCFWPKEKRMSCCSQLMVHFYGSALSCLALISDSKNGWLSPFRSPFLALLSDLINIQEVMCR